MNWPGRNADFLAVKEACNAISPTYKEDTFSWMNWPGRNADFLAVKEACNATSPTYKEDTFSSSGFSTKGT